MRSDVWAGPLEGYQLAMQAAHRAAGTIRLHRHYLGLLREIGPDPWAFSRGQLVGFMACPTWGAETRKSARTVVRGFYRWGHGMGFIEGDPAVDLPPVRVPSGVPKPAPELLVQRLVSSRDPRIELMAMLAAWAGLRAGEIARVHESDLVVDELRILGKGSKTRAVPIVEPRLLGELQRVRGWAFPNGQGSHLSPGHVSRLMSREMPDGWTAHSLRHRMATQAYAGTRDLLAVSALLGHSRPETTQRYVRLPDDALRAAARAASMLAG